MSSTLKHHHCGKLAPPPSHQAPESPLRLASPTASKDRRSSKTRGQRTGDTTQTAAGAQNKSSTHTNTQLPQRTYHPLL
jgi:hypothetical protein